MLINKNELITTMVEASDLPKKDCETVLTTFAEVVKKTLKAENKAKLVGSSKIKTCDTWTGHNPRMKKPVEIAASKATVLKAGTALKDAVQ